MNYPLDELEHHVSNLREISVEKPCIGISATAINTLIKVLDVRDPYTNCHQSGVSKISDLIAKELGFSDCQRSLIFVGSILHDIGKIAMPHDILSKPTRLTQNEYHLLQDHSTIGKNLLSDFDRFFPKLSTIVEQHHERIDGSGYPFGLSKDEILIEARIISVADVVEAMSSHRPYRPALGIEKAITEIKDGAGKIYDEDVSKAMISLYNSNSLNF
jgi:HD-GYP domain-containing protein (c-di-GMP phosphodiesterase class II)